MATLSETERELIERALDTMAAAMGSDAQARHEALMVYERAVTLVRERPPGARRLRSDFNQRRQNRAQLRIDCQ